MKKPSLFTPLLLLVLLSGCRDSIVREESEDPFTIAADQVIKESAARVEKNARLGPVMADRQQLSLQQKRRLFIGKEEKSNYLKVKQQGDEGDIFPISINFDRVEIHKAFQLLAEVVDRNILVGDEVSGEVTARIRDVPWDKALDALLNMKDLAKHVDHEAEIIRIHQRSVLTGQEAFDRQRTEALKKSQDLQQSLEPLSTELFQLHYADPAEVKAGLESVLAATAGGRNTSITVDQRTHALIIQSTRHNLDLVEKLITKMDLRTEQVLIEAYIVEVKDTFREEFGARLGTAFRQFDQGLGSRRNIEILGGNNPYRYP
ncbi:MAG: hypothetical protein HN842_12255, partial [Gammaproteobacteria bacterium]|nr:hypothetical protein [Gammaproteobacteria bacterium]